MPSVIFKDTIASGASTSSGIDLTKVWGSIAIRVSTMSTAANIGIINSDDGGTTYYNVFHPTAASSTVATPQVFISAGVGANGGICVVPANNLRMIKLVATQVVSGGVSFAVIAEDQY